MRQCRRPRPPLTSRPISIVSPRGGERDRQIEDRGSGRAAEQPARHAAPEMKTVPAIADGFARYDNAVRQVIESAVLDAAYGVMMMGDAEQVRTTSRGAGGDFASGGAAARHCGRRSGIGAGPCGSPSSSLFRPAPRSRSARRC